MTGKMMQGLGKLEHCPEILPLIDVLSVRGKGKRSPGCGTVLSQRRDISVKHTQSQS
jgi:hypothetical protein